MVNILVIADTHINPSQPDLELWTRLGEYCVKTKPDFIVHLGDVGNFDSQAWLKAARGTHTLEEELEVVKEHLVAFSTPIHYHNVLQRCNKKKMYRPIKILTLGNHDIRNDMTDVAELFEDFGWDVYEHLEPCQIDNVTFVHAMHKGLSDTMCVTARELIENWHSNIVVGHGHHKDFFESYSMATNDIITALRCPVFSNGTSDWAIQTRNKWSKGFTEIDTRPFSFVWRNLECLYEN